MYKTERTSELKQGKGDRNRYPHGAPVLLGRAWDKGRGALSGVQCTAGIRQRAAGQMPAMRRMTAMRNHRNFWDRNAGRYDRFMRKDRAAYEEMYALIRPVVKAKTVLELATGTGLIAKHIVNAANLSRSPAGLGSSPTSIFAGLRPAKISECGHTRIACHLAAPPKSPLKTRKTKALLLDLRFSGFL